MNLYICGLTTINITMQLLRLKELLSEKKVTSKSFAESLGFSQNTASNLVNGKSFPSGKDLVAIAQFFEVEVKDLFLSESEKILKPIYIEEDGKYIRIGEIDPEKLKDI